MAVYQFDAEGQMSTLFIGIMSPADTGFDLQRWLVLIPQFESDRVGVKPLP
jgi:hypothetical protein